MHTALAAALDSPSPQKAVAVLVGSDIPDVSTQILARALEALETADVCIECSICDDDDIVVFAHAVPQHQVVLGPAMDGGYYLIGLRARHACLFEVCAQHQTRQWCMKYLTPQYLVSGSVVEHKHGAAGNSGTGAGSRAVVCAT